MYVQFVVVVVDDWVRLSEIVVVGKVCYDSLWWSEKFVMMVFGC